MATFTRLKSGSWRAQVRRKAKYVNERRCRSFEIARTLDERAETTRGFRFSSSAIMIPVRLSRNSERFSERAGAKFSRQQARSFPDNGKSVGSVFRRQCRELKIEDLHFHALRHEGRSRLFEAGFTIEQVALIADQKDWKMLRRRTHELRHRVKPRVQVIGKACTEN